VNKRSPLNAFVSMLLLFMLTSCSVVLVHADALWNVQTVAFNGAALAGGSCSIVVDSKDNPHMAYTARIDGINYVKYANWDGSRWNIQTVDVGRLFDLKLDNRDDPHLVYMYGPGGIRYASRTASNWNIQIVDPGFLRGIGSVALDSLGNPHIAYLDNFKELKYASRLGLSWSIETLDNAERIWPVLSFEFGSYNTPYILYGLFHIENSSNTAMIAAKKDSSWSIQTVASNLINYGNMVLDSIGFPHFYYLPESDDTDHSNVKHASWNGSDWNIQSVALDTIGFLALDSHDNPSIAYIQSYEKVIYASWTGIAWKIQTIDSNLRALGHCQLAVDVNGNPHICYFANPPGEELPSSIQYVMYATAAASEFAPSIKVLSIADKLYDTNSIPLDFTIDEPASQIAYSLDGQENITITGNITLTGLTNGDHDLTIYVTDETGNVGSSETIHFTIDVPFPTALVAVAVIVAVLGSGLLIYLIKRK